jgi:hypothetical protein
MAGAVEESIDWNPLTFCTIRGESANLLEGLALESPENYAS